MTLAAHGAGEESHGKRKHHKNEEAASLHSTVVQDAIRVCDMYGDIRL
jgi:hypothetical protein